MPIEPPDIVHHACELFAPMGSIRVHRMFGGWGFYLDELFFALIARDTLYLKADATSAPQFEAAGGTPFTYERDGKLCTLGYWTPPDSALDSPAAMAPWARLGVDCALRHRSTKPGGRAKRKHPGARA